jgi:hypothetical protein
MFGITQSNPLHSISLHAKFGSSHTLLEIPLGNDAYWNAIFPRAVVSHILDFRKTREQLMQPLAEGHLSNPPYLVQALTSAGRAGGVASDDFSIYSWVRPNDVPAVNIEFAKLMSASAVYSPFISYAGDQDFREALHVGDFGSSIHTRFLEDLYVRGHNLKKPLYYMEETNAVTQTMNGFMQIPSGNARRINLGDFLTMLNDNQASYSFFTITGSLEKQPDGSWGFVQPTNITDRGANTLMVGGNNSGQIVIPAANVVSGDSSNFTPVLMTIGRNSGAGAMTSLVLNNNLLDIRSTSSLFQKSDQYLYVNVFGDIVTSDNMIILPAAANPVYYTTGSAGDLIAEYQRVMSNIEDDFKTIAFSVYGGEARNFTDELNRRLIRRSGFTEEEMLVSLISIGGAVVVEGFENEWFYGAYNPYTVAFQNSYPRFPTSGDTFTLGSAIDIGKRTLYYYRGESSQQDLLNMMTRRLSEPEYFNKDLRKVAHLERIYGVHYCYQMTGENLYPGNDRLWGWEYYMVSHERPPQVHDVGYPRSICCEGMALYLFRHQHISQEAARPFVSASTGFGARTLPNDIIFEKMEECTYVCRCVRPNDWQGRNISLPRVSDPEPSGLVGAGVVMMGVGAGMKLTGVGAVVGAPLFVLGGITAFAGGIGDRIANIGTKKANEVIAALENAMVYLDTSLAEITTEIRATSMEAQIMVTDGINAFLRSNNEQTRLLQQMYWFLEDQSMLTMYGDTLHDWVNYNFTSSGVRNPSGTIGNSDVPIQMASQFQAFDPFRTFAFKLGAFNAPPATEPVIGIPVFPYFRRGIGSNGAQLSTSFYLREDTLATVANVAVQGLNKSMGETDPLTTAFDVLAISNLQTNVASIFPYNRTENGRNFTVPKAIAANMYWYYTANLEDFTDTSQPQQINANLNDLLLFAIVVEASLGISDTVNFEKDVQFEEMLLNMSSNSMVGRLLSVANGLEDAFGDMTGIMGVASMDSNPLFATVVGYLTDYALLILILVLAIFAFRIAKTPNLFSLFGVSVLSLTFVYAFVFIIPAYLPAMYNSIGSGFTGRVVANTVLFRSEQNSAGLTTVDAVTERSESLYLNQTAPITVYKLSSRQMRELSEQIGVRVNDFRFGDIVVIDPNIGLYVQGDSLKMNTDVMFSTNRIQGRMVGSEEYGSYQLTSIKSRTSVVDYYMPYYMFQDGLVENLNAYLSTNNMSRRTVNYVGGEEKDSFVLYNFMYSYFFLYSDLMGSVDSFYQLDPHDQAEMVRLFHRSPAQLDLLWTAFPQANDFLRMYQWLDSPDPSVRISLWYKTLEQNGYYDSSRTDHDRYVSVGDMRRQDLITYVNYQVKRWMFENVESFAYISDETLIKMISMQAVFYFNQRVSELSNWIHPTRFNQEDIKLSDVFIAIAADENTLFIQHNYSMPEYILSRFGIVGVFVYIFLLLLSVVFSSLMNYSFPILYVCVGLSLLIRLVLGKNTNAALKVYLKATGYLAGMFTLWLVALSYLPRVTTGIAMYIVLSIMLLLFVYLTLLVYLGFFKSMFSKKDELSATLKDGAISRVLTMPFEVVSNVINNTVLPRVGVSTLSDAETSSVAIEPSDNGDQKRIMAAMEASDG